MIFVDTNYFLRFFVNQDSSQRQQVIEFFNNAAHGKHDLTTDIIVIFEIFWVLKKVYGFDNQQLRQTLLNIYDMDFIFIENRDVFLQAVINYSHFSYDLEDAYHYYYAQSKGVTKIATFDKKLSSKFKRS